MRQRRHGSLWNEPDPKAEEPRCRKTEDQVAMRLKSKSLAECELPEGFSLVTKTPRGAVVNGMVRRVFVLFCRGYWFQQVYECEVPDETQIIWAVDEFRRELVEAGVKLPRRQVAA